MTSKTKAIIYILICVVVWSLAPVVAKIGQTSLDNHQFLFWSSAVSFIVLLASTVVTKKAKNFLTYRIADWLNVIFLGFLGTYLFYILLYFGYANAQGLEVLVLQYTWPIFIVLFSVFILKEKLTLHRILAILLGFIGVMLILTKGNFSQIHLDNYLVDILVIIGSLGFGLFSVLSKKIQLEHYTLTTAYFGVAIIASFISMMWFSNFSLPTKDAIIPILVNGIFVNGFSYILWIKALKNAEASFIAPFVFLTPVLAAFYLIVFFKEPLLPVYGLGLVAVIIGGLLNNKEKGADKYVTQERILHEG